MENATLGGDGYSGSAAWFAVGVTTTVVTVLGNLLTIAAILLSKSLFAIVSNQFIFSLAVSDLLVGFSTPYHMSFYLCRDLGKDKLNCLLRFALISFACSSSVANLVVIAADRYVAIVYPLHYARFMTRKMACSFVGVAWAFSFAISCVPLVWNEWQEGVECLQVRVLPPNYMNFVIGPSFCVVWLMMLLLYTRICREASDHRRRLRNANSVQSLTSQKDSKSVQVMVTILGCFTVCWIPYLLVIFLTRVNPIFNYGMFYEIAFSLAVANSGMNPLIYAWKNRNFRKAFLAIVRCKSPNLVNSNNFVTNHVPSKKNSAVQGVTNAACKDDDVAMDCGGNILEMNKVKEEIGSMDTLFTNISASPVISREVPVIK